MVIPLFKNSPHSDMPGMYRFIDATASVTYNLPEDCAVETIESLCVIKNSKKNK